MKKGKAWFSAVLAASMLAGSRAGQGLGGHPAEEGTHHRRGPEAGARRGQAEDRGRQNRAAMRSLAKMPKWLDMISLFGDLRNRVEGFYGDNYHAQTRYRMRARVGLNANVTDEVSGTVRLASGDAERSDLHQPDVDQHLHAQADQPRLGVHDDQARQDVRPRAGLGTDRRSVSFRSTLARESELIWDDDLSPEGATETLNLWEQREGFLRSFRLNALQWDHERCLRQQRFVDCAAGKP